jgi:hypothetical protein
VLRPEALASKDSIGTVDDIGHRRAPRFVETLPQRTETLILHLPEQEGDEIVFPRGKAPGEKAAELPQRADGQMVGQRVSQGRETLDVDGRPHGGPSGSRSEMDRRRARWSLAPRRRSSLSSTPITSPSLPPARCRRDRPHGNHALPADVATAKFVILGGSP